MGKVVTWDKKSEEKDDCVFIRGEFYHKKRDCHLHNGIYYSPFSRYYVVDHENNEKVFNLGKQLKYGIIGISKDGYAFGHFSPNMLKNCSVIMTRANVDKYKKEVALSKNPSNIYADLIDEDGETSIVADSPTSKKSGHLGVDCINAYAAMNSGLQPILWSDSLGDEKAFAENKIIVTRKSAELPYAFNLAYNSETMMDAFQKCYSEFKPEVTVAETNIARLIGDFTFGIEYESWDGRIPTYVAANTGLIPLRDGSLRHDHVCGYEYASVVMRGADGINAIKRQCEALGKYTVFNEKCSMHIHVGGIPKTKENLVHIWNGMKAIQDDLFKLFPSCLANTATYKMKNYCSMLPDIGTVDVNSIVKFLSDGKDGFREFGKEHPSDSSGQSKWNINSRYYFANLNNFYYTKRGTVELRISTPTFNSNKVAALLIIFSRILRESMKGAYHTTIASVINTIENSEVKSWLTTYCNFRRKTLSKWTSDEKGGVQYYECFANDTETGCGSVVLY